VEVSKILEDKNFITKDLKIDFGEGYIKNKELYNFYKKKGGEELARIIRTYSSYTGELWIGDNN